MKSFWFSLVGFCTLSPRGRCATRCLLSMWFLHIHWKYRNADAHNKVYVNFFLLYRIFHCFYWCLQMMRLPCLCVHRNMNVIIPPHSTPPHPTSNWSEKSSACVCRTARKMMRFPCLCVHRNMNVIIPPHPTGNWSWKSSACVCRTARKMMRLPCLCVHRNMNVIIPPHPTPPIGKQCLCLQDSKKDDEVAVPVGAQEHERYHPTPPHPKQTHPTPPRRYSNWSWKSSACVCRTARKMMRLPCLWVHKNMNVIIPPHPTPNKPTPPRR